eukprot:s2326_g2.t1
MEDKKVMDKMLSSSLRSDDEIRERAISEAGEAKVLQELTQQLPPRLLTEEMFGEYRELIRKTVVEVLMVMWWRLACTDQQEAPSPETSLRSIFLLAGEPLEFIPKQFVDRAKFSAEQLLSPEQIRRMDSEAWAGSLTKKGTNASEAFKQVPPGWMTVLKGAVYRLPQFGKRVYIEVDLLEAPAIPAATPKASEQEYRPSFLQSLGPLAGIAAFILGLASKTFIFKAGQQRRMELEQTLRALQRRPEERNLETFIVSETIEDETARLQGFEQKLWTDLEPDEAPVVLVVGSETETGQVVLRKLITRKQGKEGTTFVTAVAQTTDFPGTRGNVMQGEKRFLASVPDSLYDAVSGVDKLVICDCDDPQENQGEVVGNVLRAWQLYRQDMGLYSADFAEYQRAFNGKVQIFNFKRSTDFELWDLERQYPSDMCYGVQRAGMADNCRQCQTCSQGLALFLGQFFEAYGQCTLRSPKLKLNFSRFGGILIGVYNAAVKNKHLGEVHMTAGFSWFLRTSDFERTRVQYEFEFECEATTWNYVRMPFNAFKAVRTDGVPLPDDVEMELRREDVVQMGVVFRTNGEERIYQGDRMNYFSLAIDFVKAFRAQKEPQVVYVGRADQTTPAMPSQATDGEPESEETRGPWNGLYTPPKTSAEAVLRSGVAFTMLRVKGLNEHPGGKFPVVLHQAPLERPHLTFDTENVGSISRGDVAALLVSAMSEPNCVNAEIMAGEPDGSETEGAVITSTLQLRLSSEVCFSILREYKMFNVDVVVHEDATIDDFIDVLEEAGTAPRQYCKCIYVYNKIDMLSISQIDQLARQPYSVVISVSKELNLEGLLERIWQELDLRRVYTKKKGHFPDFTDPLVLTCQRGNKTFTVENAVGLLHKSILDEFKSALVWGSSVRASPQVCGLKHELQDEDVMQITKMTAAEKIKKMHGKKTGTTLAGGNTQVDPTGKKEKEKKAPLKT